MTVVRPKPCPSCPYRRDVPSGVWHESEYRKLLRYDGETFEQDHLPFHCHTDPGELCCGWAQVHGHDLLALRLLQSREQRPIEIPECTVALFGSGHEAAEHGRADILSPSAVAVEVVGRIERKRRRRKLRVTPVDKDGSDDPA